MMKTMLPALVLALIFSGRAFAADENNTQAEGQSKVKLEDVNGQKNKVSGDIDEEITNAKLRAESGSKSKLSGSFSASYSGGSLEKPFDKNRPNPTNSPIPERVNLGGSISLRYRMDKNNSLSFGTGFSLQRPFQEAKYGDVSDPYLDYNNAGLIGKVQNIVDVIATAATNNDEVAVGTIGQGYVSDTMMYDFGGSRLSAGLALEGYYNFYSKGKNAPVTLKGGQPTVAGNYQTPYVLAAYPIMEYAISDTFQFRTVFRPWIYQHSVFADAMTFQKAPWTQSIGLGIAVARNVYLYPNFQYNWELWRHNDFNVMRKDVRNSSTVGMSATINVF